MSQQTLEDIQDYYCKALQTNDDLKNSACCSLKAPLPKPIQVVKC